MSSSKKIAIAIDGPAGAGKSTVSRAVARALGYSLVDTGAIYRSVALLASRSGIDWQNETALAEIVATMEVSFAFEEDANRVTVNGEDVSEWIRTPEISRGASEVSKFPAVRSGLLEVQRKLAGSGGAVLEGRDIGTVVFPDAPVKIFLDASCEVRAKRRFDELQAKGSNESYDQILTDIQERDQRDRTREIAPLKAADDAIVVDSSELSAESVIQRILDVVEGVVNPN